MGQLVIGKIFYLLILQVYCGFIQDSYLYISLGKIISFSENRYDPRFIVSNSFTGASSVLAINYSTIWMVRNITGTGYTYIGQRSYHQSTYSQRSILPTSGLFTFFDEQLTTVINTMNSFGSVLIFGEGSNQLFRVNLAGSPSIFKMMNINNNTVKWSYSIFNYLPLYLELQNSTIISLLSPTTPNGTLLLDVRTIINSSTASLINSQAILCSNYSLNQIKGSKNYYGIYNGSQVQVYTYCQNCFPIWTMNAWNIVNFDFCGPWFLYSLNGVIYQLYANNGSFISSLQTNYTSPQVKPVEINSYCLTNIFEYNSNTILREFLDNSAGTFAQNLTVSSTINFTNYTSLIISNSTFMNNGSNNSSNSTINSTTNSTIHNYSSPSFNISNYEIILTIISVVNSFRVRDFFRVYFIINQLGFHSYHKVNYTGTIKDILDFMNYIQSNIWTIIKAKKIIEGISNIYELTGYTDYTNSKFIEVEEKDALFFENAKDFLFIYGPISTLTFFSFHFLFRILKHHKQGVKSLFKSYYIPYGIVLVLFIQNINRLAFLACHNFRHLFYFNTNNHFMQGLTVLFVGFIVVLTISFYYNLCFLYGRKIKSLPFNLKRIRLWPTILFLRFVVKPVIEVATNAFFYQNYSFVILSLSLTQFLTVCVLSGFQTMTYCFKKKMQFVDECLLNLLLSLLNFVLYLKYDAYPELDQPFENWVQAIVYIIMGIFIIEFLIFMAEMITWIKKKIKLYRLSRQLPKKQSQTPEKEEAEKMKQKNMDKKQSILKKSKLKSKQKSNIQKIRFKFEKNKIKMTVINLEQL